MWIAAPKVTAAPPEVSLQWGHILSDVDRYVPQKGQGKETGLQWGHLLSAVESQAYGLVPLEDPRLQWGHILSDVDRFSGRVDCLTLSGMLQWGHILSEVDSACTRPANGSGWTRLQWGHILSDVDRDERIAALRIDILASMGPHPFRCG